ncbi:MAG TPA: outer membrane beta-barrel protein [Burkholderiales bacterium]|nr:outer membrane beta-barrel protein [Burkholderiales bacterium]
MKSSSLAVTVALAATAFTAPAVAQSQPPPQPAPADTWRMPYERGFWGHAGVSFGQSKLLDESCPAGFACDDKDQAFRAFAGGRFNNIFGLEFGAMNFGKFQGGGGEIDGWGGDIAVLLGIPIGANSAIFGKAGVIYARTEVSAAAPGAATGKERGWGGRYGIAGQLGLTKEWALRADYDRYEIAAPGDHRDLETLMLGVQYTFR